MKKALLATANPFKKEKKRTMAHKKKGASKSSASRKKGRRNGTWRNPFDLARLKQRLVKPAKSVVPTLVGAAVVETLVAVAPLPLELQMGLASPLTRAGVGLGLGVIADAFAPTRKYADALAEGGLVSGGVDLVRTKLLPPVRSLLASVLPGAAPAAMGELPGRFHLIPERGAGDTIVRERPQIGETFVREPRGAVEGGPESLQAPWEKSIYDN